jgi:hypothetical protein
MQHRTTGPSDKVLSVTPVLFVLPLLLFLLASPGFSQQNYVTQFDFFAGYAFLDSPAIGLFENGFQFQVGYRARTWVSLGFDYSNSRGNLTLTPDLLPIPLQQQLAAQLAALAGAGLLPPGYMLAVPAHSVTNTFAAGPQFAYRHFSKLTIFARPSLGAIHETATPQPGDPIAAAVAMQLAPSGKKTDWTGFYGFGYGVDILFNHHVGWRIQGDLVWDHLFNDLLRNGRWTTRFSTGPCFNFGKNIAAK